MTIVFLLSVASRVANSCVLVSVTLVVFANALVGFASANPESILPLMNFIVLISTCVVATSAATVACLISAARRAGLDESKMPRGTGHTEADAMPLSIHHQPSPDVTITAPVEVKADSEATEVAAVQAEDDSSRHTEQGFSDQTPGEVVINGGAASKKHHGQNNTGTSKDGLKDDAGHCLFCLRFPGHCACGDHSSGCGSGPCRCFEKDGDRKSSDGKSISTTSSCRREAEHDEYMREKEEHYEYGDGRDAFDAMMRMREADY